MTAKLVAVVGRRLPLLTMETSPKGWWSALTTRQLASSKASGPRKSKAEVTMSSVIWPQKLHSITSAIFYWSQRSTLIQYERGPHRAWIPSRIMNRSHLREWPPYLVSQMLLPRLWKVKVKQGHSDSWRLLTAQHKYQVEIAPVTASQAYNYPGVLWAVFSIVLDFFLVLSHSLNLFPSLPINSVICPIFFQ